MASEKNFVPAVGASLPSGFQTGQFTLGTSAAGTDPATGQPYYNAGVGVPSTGGVSVKTANYLATAADCGQILSFNSAGAVTLTLPAAIPFAQWTISVQNLGAGTLTVSPNGLNIDGAGASLTASTGTGMSIATDGTNYFTERGAAANAGAVYWGNSQATASGGESVFTVGSTPIAGTVALYLNGVKLNPNIYTITGAVASLTSNTVGVGDIVSAIWATTNSTPGLLTIALAIGGIRGFGVQANVGGATSSPQINFPGSAIVGDLCVIVYSTTDGTIPTPPTGWAYVDNASGTGTFWNGGSYSKTLSSGDISTGHVVMGSPTFWAASAVVFIGAPAIVTAVSSRAQSTPVTLTTSGSATIGNTAIYFGSQGMSSPVPVGTITFNRGTARGYATDGAETAGELYTETLAASGTVTAAVTYGTPVIPFGHGEQNFQTIIVVNTPNQAPGVIPEVAQSQVVGLSSALATTVTSITTTGTSGAATQTGHVLNIPVYPAGAVSSLTTTGSSGASTLSGGVLNVPVYTGGGGGGAPGALILLEEHSASNSAALSFTTRNVSGQSGATFQSDFDVYLVVIENLVPAHNGTQIFANVSSNGGSTYDTSASYAYADWRFASTAGSQVLGSSSSILWWVIASPEVSISSTASNGGLNSRAEITNPLSTAANKHIDGRGTYMDTSGALITHQFGSVYKQPSNAVNAVQFIAGTGNLTSGTIRIYGIAQ